MSSEELNDLAELLRRLQPSTAVLDRDRLMFEAGRRAAGINVARPPTWFWRGATAASSLLALVLGLALLLQPARQQCPEQKEQATNSQDERPEPPPDWSDSPYYRLPEQLLRWEPDTGPAPAPVAPAPEPATLEDLVRDLDLWTTRFSSAKENP